jgi:hypothetical protein
LRFWSDSWWGGAQSPTRDKARENAGEIGRLRPGYPKSPMEPECRDRQGEGMESSAQEAMEVQVPELGERLAQVRLLRSADPEMAASLRRYGQLSPLMCYRAPSGGLEVLDGFRRLRVAQQYGFPERLRVHVLGLDERGALGALFALHRGEVGLCEMEQGFVVRALVREQGMTQAEAAQLLRRHRSWVSRRLLLIEALCPKVQMDMRLGLLGPTTAEVDPVFWTRG